MIRVLPAPGDKWRVVQTKDNSMSGYTVVAVISEHDSYDEAAKAKDEEMKE